MSIDLLYVYVYECMSNVLKMSSIINQKEYLKKYLGLGKHLGDKKKKKKKDKTTDTRFKVIDDDVDLALSREIQEDISALNEDAPQIVAVIDERPPSLRIDETTKSKLWKPIGEPIDLNTDTGFRISSFQLKKPKGSNDLELQINKSKFKHYESDKKNRDKSLSSKDLTPPRNKSKNVSSPRKLDDFIRTTVKSEDFSPPRKHLQKKRDYDDSSPPRRIKNEDISPPRRRLSSDSSQRYKTEDLSPPRKTTEVDLSPPRKKYKNLSPARKDYSPRKRRSEDLSPPRKKEKHRDLTPPRRREYKDSSPPRRYSDLSPRKKRGESDISPDFSKKIKREKSESVHTDSDLSPPRRNKHDVSPEIRGKKNKDVDQSPRRKHKDDVSRKSKRESSESPYKNSDKDLSPPKKYKNKDLSPQRKKRETSESPHRQRLSRWSDRSPESSRTPERVEKTLSGKKAGLQSAKDTIKELIALKEKEEEAFKKMSEELSGKNAATVVRGQKPKDHEKEVKDLKKEKEMKEKYDRWGKGLKQVQDENEKMLDQINEMNKPLARYADDEDLERYLKEQEREGDPMLAYIRKKKKKKIVEAGIPEKPMYMGEFLPNRFGIRPGYRWDGVDRSSGYEKKWFETHNARKAVQEEAFRWSTEDM